ncbi:type I methionyl aminopeptidase [Candidatus Woesebacteria bacterium]|nr:type I methionyl aminopeptidase [Candidatus Woesebacteria bacterium]
MRYAAHVTAEIVATLGSMVKPGVSAGDLERTAAELCQQHGVTPAFKEVPGYSYGTCISVNDEVVHSIPYDSKVFAEGDLVSIDFGVKFNGYYSDHCRTFAVGAVSPEHRRLMEVGEAATANAVKLAVAGNRVGDLSHAMQSTAEEAGFSIVTTYVGHGIGRKLHEQPEIPAFGTPGTGPFLKENMVICVECQVCEKDAKLVHERDGWTTRTKDGGYAVMFESMVRVGKKAPEVLSK